MKYGYARVSTDGQSVEAQVRQLTKAGCKKVRDYLRKPRHSKRGAGAFADRGLPIAAAATITHETTLRPMLTARLPGGPVLHPPRRLGNPLMMPRPPTIMSKDQSKTPSDLKSWGFLHSWPEWRIGA
jgi:hypothetical protein